MYSPANPITMSHASQTLAEGNAALESGVDEFSLAHLEGSDSSALAVLLAWKRRAEQAGRALRFVDVPVSLASIAELYAVTALLDGFESVPPPPARVASRPRRS